jgi:hypothetical protein
MNVQLIEERLHEEAAGQTGLDEFGESSYRTGLRMFIDAIACDGGRTSEADVTDAARGPALRALVGRLFSERGWREHPEYASVPILGPLFIIGLPRSGTTALHQLLACDPRYQGIETWLVEAPLVRPPRSEWKRYSTYRANVVKMQSLAPTFGTIHWTASEEYDECIRMHVQCCVSNHFGSQRSVPSYDAWFLAQDQVPGIRRLADNYRLIGANAPPEQTWLLKNPSHLLNAGELLDVFPDARVVVTHRDPLRAIPSVCSLLLEMRRADRIDTDPATIGRRELEMWATAVERMQAARDAHPEAFQDVYQRDLHADPLATAWTLYGQLGLELTAATEERMRMWVAEVAPTRRGGHEYTAEQFGLSDAMIAERFASYRSQYVLGTDSELRPQTMGGR